MKKLIFIFLSFFFISTATYADVNYQEAVSKFKTSIETDSRINPIRGYMHIQFDKTKLKPDNLLNRKPTLSEMNAIAAYIEISKQYLEDIGSREDNIDLKFEGDDWMSILYKLRVGDITYLEHKKFQVGYDKKLEEFRGKVKNQKVLNLVCVFDSPKELAGSEMIVKVNFTNNTIWSSKGLNQKNFVINDNQFQYTAADDLVTTISRSSGVLTVTTPALGVFVTGSCGEAKQKKF
jgi:hypothetical protein